MERQRKILALPAGLFDCLVQPDFAGGRHRADLLSGPKIVRRRRGVALGHFDVRLRTALAVQRVRPVHDAVAGDFSRADALHFEDRRDCERTATAGEPAAGPGGGGGRVDGRGRAHPLRVRLDDCSRGRVSDFVQRPEKGAACAGGAGRVRPRAGAVGCPQFRGQRHAIRHGEFCGGGNDALVPAVSTGTGHPPGYAARAVVVAVSP